MALREDPYKVLGVSRQADLDEVRRAYRKAALRCHPDSSVAGDDEAHRQFSRLTAAYRAVLRSFGPDGVRHRQTGTRKFDPQDFTRLEVGWHARLNPQAATRPQGPPNVPGTHRFTWSRLNEPAVFMCAWALAIALAVVVAHLMTRSGWLAQFRRDLGIGKVILLLLMSLAIYAAVVAGSLVLLILTRKVIYLVGQLGFLGRRTLPGPEGTRKLPRRDRPTGAKHGGH